MVTLHPVKSAANGFSIVARRFSRALREIKFVRSVRASRPPGESDAPNAATTGLTGWRRAARQTIVAVALFSVVVNLLMLTIPIYLFQLSDRVLTSRSLDTL
jgi:ATP-binding cassette subfamily C protein